MVSSAAGIAASQYRLNSARASPVFRHSASGAVVSDSVLGMAGHAIKVATGFRANYLECMMELADAVRMRIQTPMKKHLLTRLERLEARLAAKQAPRLCYGWLAALPADYVCERHIVTVKREPSRSPHIEWYEWEEWPGPAPPDQADPMVFSP